MALLLLTLSAAVGAAACGGDSGGGDGGLVTAKYAIIEFRPESTAGNSYEIDLGQVTLGNDFTLELAAINSGEKELEIRGFRWSYAPAEPDVEADKPAFQCFYGSDRTPCADASNLPLTVGQISTVSELPKNLPIYIKFHRYQGDAPRTAQLVVESSHRYGAVTLSFSTGVSIPRIQATPTRVTFTDLRRGEEQTKYLSVLNAGSAPLRVDKFTLAAYPSFTVKFGDTEYTSTEETRSGVDIDPPLTLNPNQSIQVEVRYLPEDAESRNGVLQVHSNDPAKDWTVINLEAIQSGPLIGVNPVAIEFGPRVVGRQSALQLQLLSRGTEPLSISGIAFDAGSSPDFAVDTTTVTVNGEPISAANPLVIPPNDFRTLAVYFTPDVINDVDEVTGQPVKDIGTLVILNNSFEDTVAIPVDGYGVLQDCPVGVIVIEEGEEVIPQTNLHLQGDQSYAMVGQIYKWEWRVDQPVGSQSVFVPSPTFPNPTFEANVAGTYTFYLDVWDEEDTKSCEPATYEVVVIPDEAIHIELLWTTPGDPDETDTGPFAGSDVDLHFIHPNAPSDPRAPDLDGDGLPDPYMDQPFDCYWFNPHPDWGAFGNAFDDDPSLDRDDTDGAGPENINLNVPENGKRYQVAVHYWNDHAYGASFVTVRIYVYQILVFQLQDVRLINYDMWCVGFIDWPSGQVSLCEAPGGGYRITPNYRHPMFF
jgi:hypothetical protein